MISRIHANQTAVVELVNMSSNWSWFAVVLAATVTLLSLEADAHPIVNEATPWGAATLELRIVPSQQQQQQDGVVKETCGHELSLIHI